MDWIPFIKLEEIASLAKQTFLTLKFIKHIWFWNQVQKNLSIKPSNPYVVCFSLMLEHEKYFGAEKSKLWKEEESSHWFQNIVAGQIFQWVVGNNGGENSVCPSAKVKNKDFQAGFSFITHTQRHTHTYVIIYINKYYYIIISPIQGMIIFDEKNHGLSAHVSSALTS